MQRLFSAFPNSWPGKGLLLQRVVTATFLFYFGFGNLREAPPFAVAFPHVVGAGAGILLLLGLWTPITGMLIAAVEVWIASTCAGGGGIPVMLAAFGATLAMIGPGAWSIDARLFGRKHFEIPSGRRSPPQKGLFFLPTNSSPVHINMAVLPASICGCAWPEGNSTLISYTRMFKQQRVPPLVLGDNAMIGSMPECLDNQISQHVLECADNGSQVAIDVENALGYENGIGSRDKKTKQRLYLEEEIRAEFGEIIGESPALKTTLDLVSVVAPTKSSVLILGETGTGKELIARAIHNLSDRREQAVVKLNCASIPLGLLESELFGHEKGAFTGAIARKTGRFELADKGTLFLDEVGDIPLELQAKLLRVLQEQEFERLGSNYTHKVDVRLIAATHRDLAGMVKQGTFREDLYYRLKVFPIHVPALRQRTEDIPRLVWYFTDLYARRMQKKIDEIPADTMDALLRYRWPGNVRELQNFIERAVILSPHMVLRACTSELEPFSAHQRSNLPMNRLEEVQRDHILHALEASNWIVGGRNGAAQRLGMKRTSLVYKMRKLRISRLSSSHHKSLERQLL